MKSKAQIRMRKERKRKGKERRGGAAIRNGKEMISNDTE